MRRQGTREGIFCSIENKGVWQSLIKHINGIVFEKFFTYKFSYANLIGCLLKEALYGGVGKSHH